MLVYDKAHELAKEIQGSEEYREYKRLKEIVTADANTKPLLKEYKKLQLEAQAGYIAGSEPSAEVLDKIKKLGEVLIFNKDVTDYFAAEYKFQTLVADVYNIIGDACDLGLDFLKE
jgi:cell fate (sporulation/competence/biofilm development) regulator YlbF (YheA/YmcA/DUF963 family)